MKNNLDLSEDLIPKGIYCDGCPYSGYLNLYDDLGPISIPYCIIIQTGSMPNGTWKNNEFERLQKLLNQTEDQLWEGILGADLLWDGCKECGINSDYNNDEIE